MLELKLKRELYDSNSNILKTKIFASGSNKTEESEFLLLGVEGSFDEGLRSCSQFNSTVARIDNIEEFQFVSTLIEDLEDVESFFIGLKRENLTNSFKFDDGVNDDNSFFKNAFEIPWESDEPSDLTTNELCVFTTFGIASSAMWADFRCEQNVAKAICRRSCSVSTSANEVTVSDCINDDFEVVLINTVFKTFESAKEACSQQNSTLLRINNLNEFNQVSTLLKSINFENSSFGIAYLGLQRISYFNPIAFDFVDDLPNNNKAFYETRGIFPWLADEPSNSGECVEWLKNEGSVSNVWVNVDCDKDQKILCKRNITDKNILSPHNRNIKNFEEIVLATLTLIFVVLMFLMYLHYRSMRLFKHLEQDLKTFRGL